MKRHVWRAIGIIPLLALYIAAPAFAQGGGSTASLTGTVTDTDGGAVPGATVEVKNNATGTVERLVTNSAGIFQVPALSPGTYTVTISLSGFKTHVLNDVRVVAATAAEVKATLQIGQLNETIEVRSRSDLVQTQSTEVQSTMLTEQLNKLPLVSRNALSSVMFLPGVEQIGGYRGSTINGLPQNTINITLDGIGIGNNRQTGDGFYTWVFPRMDAVEEVTVTGATPDAASGAQGSVQIAFATRSGTNNYQTSIYHYFRTPDFNTNYYFNEIAGLGKNPVTVHQYGGRVGGPIVIPGVVDGRGKAFFFFNYERFHLPNAATRNRTILNVDGETGLFRYDVTGQINSVNVLDVAARSGQIASRDPIIANLLSNIRAAAQTTGSIQTTTSLNTQAYTFQPPSERNEYAPTTRVDFNLTDKHRLTGTYLWQRIKTSPDFLNSGEPQFPGFDNYSWQFSYRTTGSATLRSTLSSNLVNELKTGWQWSPVDFYSEKTADTFASQGGNAVTFGFGLTSPTQGNAPNLTNTPSMNLENSLSWLRGNHSFHFGGSFTRVTSVSDAWNLVPTVTLGLNTANDPANAMFTTTNFPGASNNQLNDARALYALLTGRVTQIAGTSRLDADTGQYVFNGTLHQVYSQHHIGAYLQDSWRVKPTLTLNYGVRYEIQMPFNPSTATFSTTTLRDLCGVSGIGSGPDGRQCNLFKPGTLDGGVFTPTYVAYDADNPGYKTEYNNFAPNIGIAWRPNVREGFMAKVLGDPDQATIRAGYSQSFNRERMDRFTGNGGPGANPGGSVAATRSAGNGNLVLPGESWPLLYRETSRLGPPPTCPEGVVSSTCVPLTPAYPIAATVANNLNIFDPEISLPYTRSWSVGFQRSLTQDSAVEIRYIGNRNVNAWVTENWNERNIVENDFLNEFKLAQENLRANIAAGRGNTFRYFGADSGTSPLPTYLAYFSGINPSLAGDSSRYTSANFSNTTFVGHLGIYNPDPVDAANDLHADATLRANGITAGLPPNHFVMNPSVNNANILRAAGGSRYHSLQLEYRRRLSRGLLINASYTFARRISSSLETIHEPRFFVEDDGVPHALRLNWTYDMPFGRGKRYGTDMNKILDAVVGGWSMSGTGRVQIQNFAISGARLVGMDKDQLQDEFKVRFTTNTAGTTVVLMMPDDIILNTRRAYSGSATSLSGYGALGVPEGRYIAPASTADCIFLYPGDCGAPRRIVINGPTFVRFDFNATKQFPLGRRATFDLSFQIMNMFDNINFNANFNPGSGTNIFQVTSAHRDTGVDVNDPGGRLGQIVWRLTF